LHLDLDSEFPALKKLWRAGFERPHNFDEVRGQELYEFLFAAELPEGLLRANAAVRDAIHPAFPSNEAFGHLRDYYKRRLAKRGEFSELIWLASFGYLPVVSEDGRERWGHPWHHHTGSRLVLDVADRQHLYAFSLLRLSVLSDTSEDRKTPIVRAYNRRIVN